MPFDRRTFHMGLRCKNRDPDVERLPKTRHLISLFCSVLAGTGCDRPGLDSSTGTETNGDSGITHEHEARLVGTYDNELVGHDVSEAGDTNGDGIPDWVVGAGSTGSQREGAAWIRSGLVTGEHVLTLDEADVVGPQHIAHLGRAVTALGDLDGDGMDDIALGAIHLGDAHTMQGGITILWGGTSPGDTSTFTSDGFMEHAGWDVSAAGDVDGDGIGEILVGAPYRRSGELVDTQGFPNTPGRVYLLEGSRVEESDLESNSTAIIEGSTSWSLHGQSIAGVGDLNGDGFADIMVGVPGHAVDESVYPAEGRVDLYFGPISGRIDDADADISWTGTHPGDYFGYALAGGGDLNGDGYHDVAVGAYKSSIEAPDAGAVRIISGLELEVVASLEGPLREGRAGACIDVLSTEEGTASLLIGAPTSTTDAGERTGAVYWVRDPIVGTRLLSSEERIDGTQPNERFGSSIAGVGDLDDDGFEDILVGAPGAMANGIRTGAAYLIVGEQ